MVFAELEALKIFQRDDGFEILSPQGQKWKIIKLLLMCLVACDPSEPIGAGTDVYKRGGGTRNKK